MPAPVVLVFALIIQAMPIEDDPGAARPPLMPTFVIGFLVLATINFLGLIPEVVSKLAGNASRS